MPGTNINGLLTCRGVLNIMVFFGFMVNYMLRVNITIAIVDMVIGNTSTTTNTNNTLLEDSDIFKNTTNLSQNIVQDGQIKFNWTEFDKNLLLGSFFVGYLMTELPGGRLAEVYGARRVFGYAMLLASFNTLLSPLAAKIHLYVLVALRALIGLMLGATWPAMHPMAAKWIPPNERSKFISNMMASSLGAAITLPICGFIISSMGWEFVFYITGLVGLIWSVLWFYLVFETPAVHPRISEEEREYIESSIGFTATQHKAFRVPWFKILTAPCVWAIIITHALSVFGYYTIVNQLPNYMKSILHFEIKQNGFASSLPYLGKYITALGTSCLADYLRSTNRLSLTAIRKLFTTVALFVPGVLLIFQVYFGQDRFASVAIFTLALTFNGAVTAGYLGNGLDIAPNFSGTIFGLANTLSSFGGYLSATMIGVLTNEENTFEQWKYAFWMLVGTYILGAVIFLIFGTGKLQKWNSPDTINNIELSKNENEQLKKLTS